MLVQGSPTQWSGTVPQWSRILSAVFGSLRAREQRAGDAGPDRALQALRTVIDAVPSAIVTQAPDGTVRLWSRGAERTFGWRSSEAEGRDPPYLMPDMAQHERSLRQRVLAGNEIQNQPTQRRNSAGEVRDLVMSASPLRGPDGAAAGIILVMDDVTDRRRLESSREEQRAQLAAILDAVADPIITIDETGGIISFSRAAEQVFGYATAEVIGRNIRILMPEPDRGRHDAYLRRYRETGVKRIIGTTRAVTAIRKDGRTFPAEITISEAWLGSQRIFAGILRDRTAKPAATPAAATTATADAGDAGFLSRITHDLRQPLHALALMTGALERRVEDPATREIVDHLAAVVRSTLGTFENIVEWTRIERGQVGVVPVEVEVGAILDSVAGEFAEPAERRGLELRCVSSRARITCDPALLRRILRQLLDNAVKFTPAGKVLLGARTSGPALRLIVADTGLGIPVDRQEAIFAEYTQLDAGREAGGLGLGLAIARRLSALAGLQIGLRSAPGKGSMFWVGVPRAGV